MTVALAAAANSNIMCSLQEEAPELAERKNELVVANSKMNAQLYDIETQILYLLSNSTGNILDDTQLISTLAQAKVSAYGAMRLESHSLFRRKPVRRSKRR